MRKLSKVLGILAAIFFMAASPAFADTFTWSYLGGIDSGSGTFTANPNGTPGQELITQITGTFDGSAITALLGNGQCCSSPANDNILFYPANPAYLDVNGFGFAFQLGGSDVNIYFCGAGCGFGAGYSVLTALAGSAPGVFTLTSDNGTFNVTQTPEPASIVLLGFGLAGLIFSRKKLA
jgi:hypothetical protein